MAATLEAKSEYRLSGLYQAAADITQPGDPIAINRLQSWSNGVSSNQADLMFRATKSVAAAPLNIDLAGIEKDQFGTTLTFVRVRELVIVNKSTNAADVLELSGNFFATQVLGGTSPKLKLGPSGILVLRNPLDGYGVAAGTNDIITVDPGAKTISFEIIILGNSS